MRMWIGNEHPDSFMTYPDVANLSGCPEPIRMPGTYPDARNRSGSGESIRGVQPIRVASVLWQLDTYPTIPT